MTKTFMTLLATTAAAVVLVAQNPPSQQQQQPTEIGAKISGSGVGLPPKFAVPDFIAPGGDAEAQAAAKLVGQVLWDDLNFEREFYLISRDTYRTIPQPPALDRVPLDRWKELGAEGLVVGSVQREGANFVVQVRLIEVTSGRVAFSREYKGPARNPRFFAHTISDDVHLQQVNLRGVARTKLAFVSNRDGERLKGAAARETQNVYIGDYDGANQRRISVAQTLELAPVWSPDVQSIAYTSYLTGYPDIIVAEIYKARHTRPARGNERIHNTLPAWSPDGSKLAFMSPRDNGNAEIFVMNRDGSNLRRLTNHPASDVTPTWAPSGNQIAFTSDRTGRPQIWIMNADGSGQQQLTRETWCDRPTWSPAPYNEIAYASQAGGGYDIKIYDFATSSVKSITHGEGSNESPAFSPNGKHLAFISSRAGKYQIFTVDRDGNNVRQITRSGENKYPNWSN